MKAASLVLATLGIALGLADARAQAPPRGYEHHVLRFTGAEAVRCGSHVRKRRESLDLTDEEFKSAFDCAAAARREGKAFFLSVVGSGVDPSVVYGILGLRDSGALYTFSYRGPDCVGQGCEEAFGLGACGPSATTDAIDPYRLCEVRLKRSEVPPPRQPVCEFAKLELPEEILILAAGDYGRREVGFQIDPSGHQAVQVDVAVNQKGKDVVLMLAGFKPTIWNISWSEGTRIAAVVAGGFNRQVFVGLESAVPQLSRPFGQNSPCPWFQVLGTDAGLLQPAARSLFQKNVDTIYTVEQGKVVMGWPLPAGEKWLASTAVTPESFHDRDAPLAGDAALEDAAARGILRKATKADAEAWVDALMAQEPKEKLPPIAGQGRARPRAPSLNNAYVVLKPFAYPPGLHGYGSGTFFVPSGVPVPTGNRGYAVLYDFNTMKCEGASCGDR